jgi:hypothetical protein
MPDINDVVSGWFSELVVSIVSHPLFSEVAVVSSIVVSILVFNIFLLL